jgi:hypothetical protein
MIKDGNVEYRDQPGLKSEVDLISIDTEISAERPMTPLSNNPTSAPSTPFISKLPPTPSHSFESPKINKIITIDSSLVINPVKVLGGLIPSKLQYQKMMGQFHALLNCLPHDLKITLMNRFTNS